MSQIIFTADDYGAFPSIDRGIIAAVKAQRINSVAAFSNSARSINSVQNLQRIAENLNLKVDIGCHLTLTSGKPLTKGNRDWTKKNGQFRDFSDHKRTNSISRKRQVDLLKNEMRAQINAFLNKGIEVKHISSHHGAHTWFEDYLEAYLEIGKEFSIPVRSPFMVPQHDNNKYLGVLNILLTGNLKDGYKREFNAFRKEYYNHIERLLKPRNQQPTYETNSSHYGPIPLIPIGAEIMDKFAEDKRKILEKVLEKLPEERIEFIFHVIENNYAGLKKFKKESKRGKFKYDGVNRKYFDGRMVEYRSLIDTTLPSGISLCQWP